MKSYTKSVYNGQAMSETGITIALVAIVSIAGLTLLSGNIQDALKSYGVNLGNDSLAALTAKPTKASSLASNDTKSAAQSLGNETVDKTSTGDMSIKLANGEYLELKNYPADLNQSIETAGANGTTNLLLGTMESLIQQTMANGTITPEDANALAPLAVQGHVIADKQVSIQAAIMKSYKSDYADDTGFNEGESKEGAQEQRLLNLLTDAQSAGALKDPVLNQSISTLVNQIVNISNGVENAAYNSYKDSVQYKTDAEFNQVVSDTLDSRDEVLGNPLKQSLLTIGASAVTAQKADEICTAGKAGDKCH